MPDTTGTEGWKRAVVDGSRSWSSFPEVPGWGLSQSRLFRDMDATALPRSGWQQEVLRDTAPATVWHELLPLRPDPMHLSPQRVAAYFLDGGTESVHAVLIEIKDVASRSRLRSLASAVDEAMQELVPAPNAVLDRATRIESVEGVDAALDEVYRAVDRHLLRRRFAELDSAIKCAHPESHSVDVVLALLTATLPARSELPSRKGLLARLEALCRSRGIWEPGLLAGLD